MVFLSKGDKIWLRGTPAARDATRYLCARETKDEINEIHMKSFKDWNPHFLKTEAVRI
jgi:hypothetical protein